MKNRVTYFLVLLGAFLFFFCFDGYLSTFVLIAALLLPFISLACSLPGIFCAGFLLAAGAPSAEKGGTVPLRLEIRSRFPISGGRAEVTLSVQNTLIGESQEENLTFILCRGSQAIQHQLSSPVCGQLICSLSQGRAWDYLGLFSLPLRLPKEKESVLFYPTVYPACLSAETVSMPNGEGEAYSKTKPGDDPAELFGLREYREGDRLSRIHWKLSQKSEQLMVKELGLPVVDHLFFLLELNGSPVEIDGVLDAFATFSDFLAEREIAHRLGFWGREGLRLAEITGPAEAKSALQALLISGRRGSLPSLEGEPLPQGVSHAFYLSCGPDPSIVEELRAHMPSAKLSVLQITEGDAEPPKLDVDFTVLTPARLEAGLDGFTL